MGLDRHGQPKIKNFNAKRNVEKAVSGLLGILQGLTADQKIGEREVLFLDTWLRNQESIKDDPDLIDVVDLIGDILKDGIATRAELDDLHSLLTDIVEFREFPYLNAEARANELIGVITGVAADGELVDSEISLLHSWLNANADLVDEWPVSAISQRLRAALADGVISTDERTDLLSTIKQITGDSFEQTSIACGMSTEFFEDPLEIIEHAGRCFCFTGHFVSGGRATVESSAVRRGARVSKNVSAKVDYLVIGTLASRDWRFSAHGRKIEHALRLRKNGVSIAITTERTWLNFLT
jgi:NAD-dependent DNA ligase